MTIEHLRQLHQQATPGPWNYDDEFVNDESGVGIIEPCSDTLSQCDKDGELIAAMRNALPHLLDIAELLKRLNQWDALNPPIEAPYGDAPYWKKEIEAALARLEDA